MRGKRESATWPTVFLNRAHSSGVRVSALAITGITFTWEEGGQREEGGEGVLNLVTIRMTLHVKAYN